MQTWIRTWLLALAWVATAGAEVGDLATAVAETHQIPREFQLDGLVEAVHQSTLTAQTSGQVQEIRFDVDDFVHKGALLIRLKDSEHQARLAQASADLEAAAARYREAQEDYRRVQAVFAKQAATRAALDQAEAELKGAKARLEAATASRAQAEEQLSYTQILAPYSGIVTKRLVQIGESAQPGTPLMAGVSLEALRVILDVPQGLVPQIRAFGQARIQIPGDGWVAASQVTVFPYADPGSNSFRVRLDLPPGTRDLFPGMFVKAAFVTGQKQALLIPGAAVVHRSEVTGAYVVAEDGQISFRHLRIGQPREPDRIAVLAGLVAGERLALDPVAAGALLKRQRSGSGHE